MEQSKEKNIFNFSNVCNCCKTPLLNDKTCEYCESRNVFFDKLYYLLEKNETNSELLVKWKFQEEKHLEQFFLSEYRSVARALEEEQIDLITQAPSHKKSIRKRGYVHLKPILEQISQDLKIPFLDLLQKNSQEHQSHKKFRERYFHARTAFQFRENQDIKGKTILLVDDIFTTGASLNEISKILKWNGAKKIILFCLVKSISELHETV